MQKVFVVHYNEIALKGRNRPDFLRQLRENICRATGVEKGGVRIVPGRVLVTPLHNPSQPPLNLSGGDVEQALKRVFGVSSFSSAVLVEAKYEEIEKAVRATIDNPLQLPLNLRGRDCRKTFAIRATRGDKKFPMTSKDLEIRLGDFVRKKFNKKVDLTNPDVTFYVEVFANGAVVYTQKIPGAGGLPVGIQGKAVALLSGGIDSPVAAYRVMKRGVEIIGAHFHSYPFTSRASIDKVKDLANVLGQYGGMREVYFIPIAEAQKEIVKNCQEQYRVLLYRRLMFRIAQKIAVKYKARALVTGESLGQVASQTLENIVAVEKSATLPIFRPLIGYDKNEIITEAKQIGTYEISIQPHDDCCTLFMPKQVITRARVQDVDREEESIDVYALVNDAITRLEIRN